MSDPKIYVRILLDGLTMNGQVCMAGDIMEDPPYPIMKAAQEGGILGEKGKVVELISASEVEKLLGEAKLHAPVKTKHQDPEGLAPKAVVHTFPGEQVIKAQAEKDKVASAKPPAKAEKEKESNAAEPKAEESSKATEREAAKPSSKKKSKK